MVYCHLVIYLVQTILLRGTVIQPAVMQMKRNLQFIIPIILFSVVLRACVGLWGYSGHGKPPMFGDFEAQRHWMEITTALPMQDWYRQCTENDLLYWGLDYPPLTAYTSQLFGNIAHYICPELVSLHTSRGHESVAGKLFMRASVLLCDVLLLFPAIAVIVEAGLLSTEKAQNSVRSASIFLLAAVSPALILIDHGHFQYNGVSIALALLGGAFIVNGYDLWGSILFSLSLNFKQMSLYYAPVFFFSLLRKCWEKRTSRGTKQRPRSSVYSEITGLLPSLLHLAAIGGTVIATFALLWLPFCHSASPDLTCADTLLQILHRLFPFSRGIFEDKVSNLWYTLSVLYDFRQLVSSTLLIRTSLILTLTLLAPVAYDLLRHPLNQTRLLLSLINSSLAFFLASFQVHEKSLLLALLPAALIVHHRPIDVAWFQIVGCMTMYPLLMRDGQSVPYFVLLLLYGVVLMVLLDDDVVKQLGVKWALVPAEGKEAHRTQPSRKKSTPSKMLWKSALAILRYLFMFVSCAGKPQVFHVCYGYGYTF